MLLRFSPLDIRAMPPKILRAGVQPQLSTQNPEAPHAIWSYNLHHVDPPLD